jgi:hypothetical protein
VLVVAQQNARAVTAGVGRTLAVIEMAFTSLWHRKSKKPANPRCGKDALDIPND